MNPDSPCEFDVAIIGGGSGGYAAARTAAAAGLKTAVIEGAAEIGGLCILRGCMPTKALLYAAEVMHLASHPQAWGIRPGGARFDFARIMARKNSLIEEFAAYRRHQLTEGKFEFIRANARFLDAHTLELRPPHTTTATPGSTGKVEPAGPMRRQGARANAGNLAARHFIIATGSTVAPPPLPDLAAAGYLDSDAALKLTKLPESLLVLGGGSVALEFAQFFARFGVQITLIQRSPHVLHAMDPDAADVVVDVFRREGLTVYTGTKLLEARRRGRRKEVVFEHGGKTRRVSAAEIFFGLGRTPNLASLGLDAAGVRLENGRIRTNALMQTSVPHIYAAGDCTGPHEIVHLAVQQGEIAAHNIAHPSAPRHMDYRLLITVVFTEPQVACVGLTEVAAAARQIRCRVARYPFADHGKSLIMEARDGFVKLLADPQSGEILGGACVGPVGGDLIHEVAVAMARRMSVHEFAAVPHYHPTLAEIWTYPAEELAAEIRRPNSARG
jgi:pyruvate/2-oxoglutarate dehydrogenase complex dihydrolipoamide dehydrogenase (E3) component